MIGRSHCDGLSNGSCWHSVMFQPRRTSASPAVSGHLAWAPKTSKQASVDVIRDVMMIHPLPSTLPPFQSLRRGPEGSRVFRLLGRLLAWLSPLPSAPSSVLVSVPAVPAFCPISTRRRLPVSSVSKRCCNSASQVQPHLGLIRGLLQTASLVRHVILGFASHRPGSNRRR